MANYRVLVHYDPERSVFYARAPELEHCSAEGVSRTEALSKLEEEISAQLQNIREQGGAPPPAVDEESDAWSGELAVKVSKSLHRDLAWQARVEGVELEPLLAELLVLALDVRRQRGGQRAFGPRPQGPNAQLARGAAPGDEGGGDSRLGGPRGRDDRQRRGGGGGGRYFNILEDRAAFMEYVRGLESGATGPSGNTGRRRGRGRGRSGGPAGGGPGTENDDGRPPRGGGGSGKGGSDDQGA
ncbi:MAG: type II toxin-antitoxin system HicB family antitoxin [Deltaproteobacteria bacterium]|nr:type II toxin-antitoxin system HicB family antitoxin [Deltaproteobacteria bacterium]